MLHCNIDAGAYLHADRKDGSIMSRQLAVASAFSIFALSALALFAPGSARVSDRTKTGATTEIAAPALIAELPFVD
jgi:hypothetical protein